ncbi:LysR family transcriptional regulator [Alicyclobacillus fastidiosus]|uniref:LysR family transcriptional regulator n=1 Tax=Alicyclobacillus fastidiosus TaxID=392011 RepID=A0ABV5ACL8_9BACL|nr:LysR family transcriptional regulator [Alicyclobacillus fastidiosus]WEH11326.1 LysR family transcriptional regulator [Alicyclobacillus fastidiosus]
MELEWLRTFLVAAEEGNYHRAARRLHIAQPTVSLHIRKLEQAFGVTLFQRAGRTVELSASGRRALVHAKKLYSDYLESQEDLARFQQSYDETLTVAVSPIVALTFLSRWLDTMQRTAPTLQFNLLVVDSADVVKLVESREADIGFARVESTSKLVASVPLYADPIRFVIPASDVDHDGPPPSLTDIFSTYPIVTHNHPGFWDDLVARLRFAHPRMRTMRVSRAHVALHFVEQGLAASCLPASIIRQPVLWGRILEMPDPEVELPMAHTYLVSRDLTGTAAAFARTVEAYMESHWESVG